MKNQTFPPMGAQTPSCKTRSYEFYIKLDTDSQTYIVSALAVLFRSLEQQPITW